MQRKVVEACIKQELEKATQVIIQTSKQNFESMFFSGGELKRVVTEPSDASQDDDGLDESNNIFGKITEKSD